MMPLAVAIQRVRLRLSRSGKASALTHLQQIETVRRALKNSGWPVATSGKKSRIKVSFGPAISVGYESEAEYCDVEMGSRLDLSKAKEEFEKALPEGFRLTGLKSIPRFFPSLEQTLNLAFFEVSSPRLAGSRPDWEAFERAERYVVVKKKEDREVAIDARPCVRAWDLSGERLKLELRFGPGRTLKPERIIQAVCHLKPEEVEMGGPACILRVKRTQLFFEKPSGELIEP